MSAVAPVAGTSGDAAYGSMVTSVCEYLVRVISFYVEAVDQKLVRHPGDISSSRSACTDCYPAAQGCGKHGNTKKLNKALRKPLDSVRQLVPAARLAGDCFVPSADDTAGQAALASALRELQAAFSMWKKTLSESAAQAKDPRRKRTFAAGDGRTEREAERLNRIEEYKAWKRERSAMVVTAGEYVQHLVNFCLTFHGGSLHVKRPGFAEFLQLNRTPECFKSTLKAAFAFELATADNLIVQRFVANAIAHIALDDAELVGAQGMDRLGELALVQDDETNVSTVCAAYKVATSPSSGAQAQKLAHELLDSVKANGGSKKALAAAVAAQAAIKGGSVVQKAAAATGGLLEKGMALIGGKK